MRFASIYDFSLTVSPTPNEIPCNCICFRKPLFLHHLWMSYPHIIWLKLMSQFFYLKSAGLLRLLLPPPRLPPRVRRPRQWAALAGAHRRRHPHAAPLRDLAAAAKRLRRRRRDAAQHAVQLLLHERADIRLMLRISIFRTLNSPTDADCEIALWSFVTVTSLHGLSNWQPRPACRKSSQSS